MNDFTSQSDSSLPTVDELAEQFLERRRSGEQPEIDEYVGQYPQLADDIHEVFPALMAMESLKRDWQKSAHHSEKNTGVPVEQLGDYRLLREIGRGGMGIVYEAVQESLNRHVALKLLPQHAVSDPSYARRLQREAKTAASLHHSNIVPVFGVGEEQGYHYIVMQLIPGAPLDRVIRLLREPGGEALAESISSLQDAALTEGALGMLVENAQSEPATESHGNILSGLVNQSGFAVRTASWDSKNDVTPPRRTESEELSECTAPEAKSVPRSKGYWKLVARIGSQIADALSHAHEHGTLHRDIKPGNILFDLQGAVWITDFGLAHATDGSNATQSGSLAGTLAYMAPEQFDGKSDQRSDVYSLGLTLYELTTLQPAIASGTRAETIARATESSPTKPRSINPNIPADLQTIILKAIAREPEHRYESAAGLAEDLQFFAADRPIRARHVSVVERFWRWCRRNPGLAVSTTGCVLLLVTSTIGAVIGYAHEAKQRQKMQSMLRISLDSLDRVYDRFIPEQISTSALLIPGDDETEASVIPGKAVLSPEAASMLEELLPAFDQLAQQFNDDESLKANAAEANRRVGDIHLQLNNYDRAIAAYREANRRYSELPVPENWIVQRAAVQNEIGSTLMQQGKSAEAVATHRAAISLLLNGSATDEAIVDAVTSSLEPAQRFELARSYYLLGKRGQAESWGVPDSTRMQPPGIEGRGRPRDLNRPLPSRPPGHVGVRRDDRPFARRPPGVLTRSEAVGHQRQLWLRRAIQQLEVLRSDDDEAEYAFLLALCRRDQSTDSNPAGRQSAIDLLLQLTETYPSNARFRYELSRTYASFNGANEETELKSLRAALEHIAVLTEDHPDVAAYAISSAHTNHRMSMALRNATRAAPEFEFDLLMSEAAIHAQNALTMQRRATRDADLSDSDAFWLVRFGESLSEVLLMNHKPAAAINVLHDIENDVRNRRSKQLSRQQEDAYNHQLRSIERRLQVLRSGPPR